MMKGAFRVTPCTTVRLEWRCECSGTMVYASSFTGCNGAKHTHECDKCGRTEEAPHVYPRIEHREDAGEVWFEKMVKS